MGKKLKKIFLLISILFCLISMNFIKADINLMNGTQGTINIYPSDSAIESATPISIEPSQKMSLIFPIKENSFIIQLADDLFFTFSYEKLNDKENYLIIFGKNLDKYACCLIGKGIEKQDGILTLLNKEQLKINFLKHIQGQEKKDKKELTEQLESSTEIEGVKEIKLNSSGSDEEW